MRLTRRDGGPNLSKGTLYISAKLSRIIKTRPWTAAAKTSQGRAPKSKESPFLRITLSASRTEIVVSHLSILRLLAFLTNRRNQNATPVERISSTTAFAPLNNGSMVVIMSRKKAADSIAKS